MLRRTRDPVDDGNSGPLCVVTYNILANQNALRDADRGNAAERMYAHGRDKHIAKWRWHLHFIWGVCLHLV